MEKPPFPPDPGEPPPNSFPPLDRTTTDAGTDAVVPAPGTGIRPQLPDLAGTASEGAAFADSSAERAGPLSHWGLKVRPTQPVLLGDFRLLRKLGSGSMGAVYLARQVSRDRDVALKVLFQHLAGKAGFVGRFEREARVLAGLRHPNIVCLYERGEADGFHYLALEHIDGPSLLRVLTALGGRLPLGDAVHVVLRCAAGLGHAHERHIVHRDVKPSNIMLTQLGQVKLTDLGLAKHVEEDPSLTDSGATLGTPQYVAPEQARNARRADARSDIYSLGCVLYHFLTGTTPFKGDSPMELLLAKEQGLFPSVRRLNHEVPPRLGLIVERMLARDPGRRYPSCAELTHDLEGLGLASPHLSFNPLHPGCGPTVPAEEPPPARAAATGRVEILLLADDPDEARLAREALQGSGIPSRLHVLRDAWQALAFLRREGEHAAAPRPNLLILGLPLTHPGALRVLLEIKTNRDLRGVPVIVVSNAEGTEEFLHAHGLPITLRVRRPEDLPAFERLLQSAHELCLTVVQVNHSGCRSKRGV
jgi:serine/threonine protein kinase